MAFTAKPIRVGRIPGGGQENALALEYKTGETFLLGAVLTLDTGQVKAAANDPITVAGIALQGAVTNPGEDAGNSPVEVTGVFLGVSFAVADKVTQFVSDIVNTVDAATTPLIADIGTNIGLSLRADGTWAADRDAVNLPITIIGIDLDNNSVIWTFTSAALEL